MAGELDFSLLKPFLQGIDEDIVATLNKDTFITAFPRNLHLIASCYYDNITGNNYVEVVPTPPSGRNIEKGNLLCLGFALFPVSAAFLEDYECISVERLHRILSSPGFPSSGLEACLFNNCQIDDQSFILLADACLLLTKTVLIDLGCNRLTLQSWERLIQLLSLPSLRFLRIYGNPIIYEKGFEEKVFEELTEEQREKLLYVTESDKSRAYWMKLRELNKEHIHGDDLSAWEREHKLINLARLEPEPPKTAIALFALKKRLRDSKEIANGWSELSPEETKKYVKEAEKEQRHYQALLKQREHLQTLLGEVKKVTSWEEENKKKKNKKSGPPYNEQEKKGDGKLEVQS